LSQIQIIVKFFFKKIKKNIFFKKMLDKDLSNVIKCPNSLYFSGILLDSIYMEDFKTGDKNLFYSMYC